MGVPPMKHGQDVRATPANKGFCKSLSVLRLGFAGHHLEEDALVAAGCNEYGEQRSEDSAPDMLFHCALPFAAK